MKVFFFLFFCSKILYNKHTLQSKEIISKKRREKIGEMTLKSVFIKHNEKTEQVKMTEYDSFHKYLQEKEQVRKEL